MYINDLLVQRHIYKLNVITYVTGAVTVRNGCNTSLGIFSGQIGAGELPKRTAEGAHPLLCGRT